MKPRLLHIILLLALCCGFFFIPFTSSATTTQQKNKTTVSSNTKKTSPKKSYSKKVAAVSSNNKKTKTQAKQAISNTTKIEKKKLSSSLNRQNNALANKQSNIKNKNSATPGKSSNKKNSLVANSKNTKKYPQLGKKTVHTGVTVGKQYKSSLHAGKTANNKRSVNRKSSASHRIYNDANFCPSLVALGNNVVKIARGQLGARYRSGGFSPKTGFDCSGFVHWVYSQYGLNIPRDSASQKFIGKAVSKDGLLPGDVLIFSVGRRSHSGYHSVIYIGRGNFIHSPNSRSYVRVNSLSDDFWANRNYVARRLLNDDSCELPKSDTLPFLKNNVE